MEKTFNEQESLRVITEMIENTKSKFCNNSFFYLLWGWLVLLASAGNFILVQIGYAYSWLPWPVLMFGGGIVSVIAGIRMGKKAKVVTMFDTMMIYLWNGFLVTLFIILFVAASGNLSWNISNALIIALYGLGTFVSGGVLKFKPLIFGGVISWAIAVATVYVPENYSLLMVTLSITVTYLIPGYLLKFRKNS
jgi:hypothetical protein